MKARVLGYTFLLLMGVIFPGVWVMGSCAGEGVSVIAIEVNPLCIQVAPGATQQFNATVFIDGVMQAPNPDNTAVTWSVFGGDVNGVVSNAAGTEGQYTAPNTVPPPAEFATIIATSNEDDQKQGQASAFLSGSCPVVPPTPQP